MNTISIIAAASEGAAVVGQVAEPPPQGVGVAIFLLILAVIFNAFFAASEIAIISLKDAKVKRDAENGKRIDKILCKFISEPTRFLATIQVGITLAGFLASAFAAVTLADPLANVITSHFKEYPELVYNCCTILVTIVLAFVTLIFGELVPKRIAMQHSERLARFSAVPLRAIAVFARPFVSLLNWTTNGVLRLIGIDPKATKEEASEEEIRMLVDIGGENGTIEQDEMEMIENVFEFNNTVASEIMVHRRDIVAIPVTATEEECKEIIRSSNFSRIPVYEENIDNIKGILNSRDFLLKSLDNNHINFMEILRKPLFVPETIRADVLFSQMQKSKQPLAIVLDEYGGTSGLISLEDLLEEIVGEIYDEYDQPEEEKREIETLGENEYRVPGEMQLDEVIDFLKLPTPEGEDFNTFAGIVFDRLKTVPTVGTVVPLPKLHVEAKVEKMDGNRIESLIVKKTKPQESEEYASSEEE
ncbi:MAG: HlyC/CorC family transporter [Kiritimatiellae bacterium]|nr:HlyC/CorC family transporter [Kiritimatiellia bacterium]